MELETKVAVGKNAEDEAEVWIQNRLERIGSGRILHRNFRTRSGEIDWIFEEGEGPHLTLVILEVRSRSYKESMQGTFLFDVRDTFSLTKRMRIERTARWFLTKYGGRAKAIRLDLLVRNQAGKSVTWTHLPGAWLT